MSGNVDDKASTNVGGDEKLDNNARRILYELTARIEQTLADKNNDGAYDIVGMVIGEAERRMVISRTESAQMLLNIQGGFCIRGDFGRASEMVKSAAEKLIDEGAYREAAEAYYSFAEELFQHGQYGWAGARYYNAALIFVRRGMLDEARKYLQKARERFMALPRPENEFWTVKLREHLAILCGGKSRKEELVQLSQLRFEFMAMSRDNWVKACEEGSQRIMAEVKR